jgi:hypothetical protein
MVMDALVHVRKGKDFKMFPSLDDIFKTYGLAVCNEAVGKTINFLEALCHQLQNIVMGCRGNRIWSLYYAMV